VTEEAFDVSALVAAVDWGIGLRVVDNTALEVEDDDARFEDIVWNIASGLCVNVVAVGLSPSCGGG
jgi:hypothetical protein